MSDVRKFKFVSPGIFLREIDNSQLPAVAPEVGPVVIGRARKGPAMRPIQVNSFSEFVNTFGTPIAGGGGGDYFRDGNISGPTYGPYAAQAYLDANVGPVTYVRTLGDAHPNNDASVSAKGGWNTGTSTAVIEFDNADGDEAVRFQKGGAYGLFICQSGSSPTSENSGSLAAIWYCNSGSCIALSGSARGTSADAGGGGPTVGASGSALVVESSSGIEFKAQVLDSLGNLSAQTSFNFDRNSAKYIRKVFNTNPTFCNSTITDQSLLNNGDATYWLGETYDSALFERLGSDSGTVYGFIAAINSGSTFGANNAGTNQWADRQTTYINPRTGWFFAQDLTTDTASYDAQTQPKLFCFHARDYGEAAQEQYKISIQDIRQSTNDFDAYGTFTVVIRASYDSDAAPVVIERFSGCNLNPQSQNYVARKIGDRYVEWDYDDARMRQYGEFDNRSEIVRIEMNPDIGAYDERSLPFGVFGPPRPPGFMVISGSATYSTGSNIIPLLGTGDQTTIGNTGAAAATATITTVAEASIVDTKDFTLTDTAGVTTTYNLSTGGGTGTNGDAYTPGTTVTVGLLGTTTRADVRDQLITRINAGTAIGFTAAASGEDVVVTQDHAGIDGNRTNTDEGTGLTVGNFVNGAGGGYGIGYSYVAGTSSCAGNFAGMSGYEELPANLGVAMRIQTSIGGANTGAGAYQFTSSLFFPSTLTRLSASDHGVASGKEAYWGLQTNTWTSGRTSTTFDQGYRDYLRGLPLESTTAGFDTLSGPPTNNEYSWIFTLDDIIVPDDSAGTGGNTNKAYWASGSRQGVVGMEGYGAPISTAGGTSVTAGSTYESILDYKLNKFTTPLYGGFDGFNIKEKDPFRDGFMSPTATALNNYAYNTIEKAVNTVKDPEFVEMNMLTVPGIVNENLTKKVLNVCEERGDALGIIDLRGVYQPFTENYNNFKSRVTATSLAGVVTALRDRSINSSYGCTYYPWVQVTDTMTGQRLWAPPSVAAIGTFASSESRSEVWFAPAGFNRGGLTGGAAGIPVTAVTEKLSSSDRDTLYEANINPIASFPSEGLVVFGQKTLQVTPSALDRINVRRLMIYIKKEISRIAAGILFDQNVRATWTRFTNQANPLLASVQSRLGLTEFKVVLDETTTTPDLIDRNIMYAKIFLKPAYAIEFIAIDFNITRTGASFED